MQTETRLVKRTVPVVAALQSASEQSAPEQKPTHRQRQGGIVTLSAKALKVSCALDPVAIAGLELPTGVPRILFAVTAGEQQLTGHVAAKSLRRAQGRIAELGPAGVVIVLQAKLAKKTRLEEVGIAAQPKGPPPPAAALSTPNPSLPGPRE